MSKSEAPARRSFLKSAAAAVGIPALASSATVDAALQPDKPAAGAPSRPPVAEHVERETISYPRSYTGRKLSCIAFPLGGVCAGSLSLGGRGNLRDWEIFNRPDKGVNPEYAFPGIRVEVAGSKAVARVLEARIAPPYEGNSGLGTRNAPGLTRLQSATFTSDFPFAKIAFRDPKVPVKIDLTAFSPFIPHDPDTSGIPGAVLRYRVTNPGSKPAKVSIAWAVENPVKPRDGNTSETGSKDNRRNELRDSGLLQGLLMDNPGMAPKHPANGSFALAAIASGARVTRIRGWQKAKWWVGPMLYWDDFKAQGELSPESDKHTEVGALSLTRDIPAGATADFTFLLAWHFPNRTPAWCGWESGSGRENEIIGNWYATKFSDAWAVADHLATNLEKLEKESGKFASAINGSTLPPAVKDAATANLSTLVSQTCFRTADGEFHGFEGVGDHGGCCHGNCTHVWNYETATEFLFPQFARSLRKAAYGYSMDERGCIYFRQHLPEGSGRSGFAAADGQMGQIIKTCLDWRLTGDMEWLRSVWPKVRKALEFCWVPGGWDANRDGVMEGVQHNTYDIEFYGPNPLCGIYYLGALRAAEEMALGVGDKDFASECHRLFESGSKWIDANLFNGEYYVQKIRAIKREDVAKGLTGDMGADDPEHPDFQLGEGCLADQLIGEYLAHIAGLGDLLDPAHIRKTLNTLWSYNHYENLFDRDSVERAYIMNDEQAMVVCNYGSAPRPKIPFPYSTEAWTGIEYLVGSLFFEYGMLREGVDTFAGTRRRHDGERRNPFNEPECGHHYARAMSSWSGMAVLSAFRYDGPEHRLRFERKAEMRPFSSFWATGTGWGRYTLTLDGGRTKATIEVLHGSLPVREFTVEAAGNAATLRSGNHTLDCQIQVHGKLRRVSVPEVIGIHEGEALELIV
jgi:non-lysosomal glucosylceramidase